MSFPLFKNSKAEKAAQFQVGLIDDSDDDDFVDPPLVLKKRNGRKISGNHLLSGSASIPTRAMPMQSSRPSSSPISNGNNDIDRSHDIVPSYANEENSPDTDSRGATIEDHRELFDTPSPWGPPRKLRKGVVHTRRSMLSLPKQPQSRNVVATAIPPPTPTHCTPLSQSPPSMMSDSSPSVLQQWKCGSCTLYNDNHAVICSMCDTPRDVGCTHNLVSSKPVHSASQSATISSSSCDGITLPIHRIDSGGSDETMAVTDIEVPCPKCTFLNSTDSFKCGVCEYQLQKKTTRSMMRISTAKAKELVGEGQPNDFVKPRTNTTIKFSRPNECNQERNSIPSVDFESSAVDPVTKQWRLSNKLLDGNIAIQQPGGVHPLSTDTSTTDASTDTSSSCILNPERHALASSSRNSAQVVDDIDAVHPNGVDLRTARTRGLWSPPPSSSDEDDDSMGSSPIIGERLSGDKGVGVKRFVNVSSGVQEYEGGREEIKFNNSIPRTTSGGTGNEVSGVSHMVHTRRGGAPVRAQPLNIAITNHDSDKASVTKIAPVLDLTELSPDIDVSGVGAARMSGDESDTGMSDTDLSDTDEEVDRRRSLEKSRCFQSTNSRNMPIPLPKASDEQAVDVWDVEDSDSSGDDIYIKDHLYDSNDHNRPISNDFNYADYAFEDSEDEGVDEDEDEDEDDDEEGDVEFIEHRHPTLGNNYEYNDGYEDDIADFEDDDNYPLEHQNSHPIIADHFTCVKDLNIMGTCTVDFNSFVLKSTCMRQSNTYENRQSARVKKTQAKKSTKRKTAAVRRKWKPKKK